MGPLEACFGPLGGLLGPLGGLLGPSWGPLGASWAPLAREGGIPSPNLGPKGRPGPPKSDFRSPKTWPGPAQTRPEAGKSSFYEGFVQVGFPAPGPPEIMKRRSGTRPEAFGSTIFGQNRHFTRVLARSRLLTISLPNAIFVMILRKPCIFLIRTALLSRFPRILGPLGRPNWILDL